MFCSKCGSSLESSNKFCSSCGHKVMETTETSATSKSSKDTTTRGTKCLSFEEYAAKKKKKGRHILEARQRKKQSRKIRKQWH